MLRGGVHWLFDLINVGERGGVESSRVTMSVASSLRTRRGESLLSEERKGLGRSGGNGKRAVEGPLSRRWIPPGLCASPLDPLSFRGLRLAGAFKKRSACHRGQVIDERQKSLLEDTKYLKGVGGERGSLSFYGILMALEGSQWDWGNRGKIKNFRKATLCRR